MPPRETTRRIASATALVALLFMAAAALRGYLPGAEPGPRPPAAEHPLASAVVVGLLAASVAVVAVAGIARLRNRTASAPSVADRADWLRDDWERPSWRVALIAFGLILGWLLLSVLLARLGGGGPDGTTAPRATPTTASPSPEPDRPADALPQPDKGSDLLGFFSGAAGVLLVVLVAGSIVEARRRRRPASMTPGTRGDDSVPDSETGSESLARAAEVGLAEVGDLSVEPRKAIIACYAAMERELSLLPDAAPREFDTASEVHARAVDNQALAPDSATQLVDLFDEARFSPHVMNESHRDAAVAVLTHVLGELRSHA